MRKWYGTSCAKHGCGSRAHVREGGGGGARPARARESERERGRKAHAREGERGGVRPT